MSRETDACRRYVDTIPGDRFDIAIRGARAVGREAVNCVRIGDVKGSSFCARRAAGFYFAAIEIARDDPRAQARPLRVVGHSLRLEQTSREQAGS